MNKLMNKGQHVCWGRGGEGRHHRGVNREEPCLVSFILVILLLPDQRGQEGMGNKALAGEGRPEGRERGETRGETR